MAIDPQKDKKNKKWIFYTIPFVICKIIFHPNNTSNNINISRILTCWS
ncbi:hypothetical protein Patl1_05792 [Pistacia atlantica]|uniref:Uncharacterized protein n=1 Tax=Pistacia atlantica TaxID=434234 RepID=A0ACC1BSL0_9ROSI|nr:hypothetical protein Patl1_05792 [Pistacia atlantica]